MKYGICTLSIVPVRKEPSHKSELVTQLLFGETYEVVSAEGNWRRVSCSYDGYEGWIDENQHHPLADKDYAAYRESIKGVALELSSSASSNLHSLPVTAGCTLPNFDGMNFKIGREKFIYNGQAVIPETPNKSIIERVALRYLNAPYLWGGRSPFGIDCSGYTQIVFKFCGVAIKRDAYQQAELGSAVDFVEESQTGDLAFFANAENRITHVGIVLKDQRIIHAAGKVRIDKLDHFGIYNAETKKYTHQLKLIKRFF